MSKSVTNKGIDPQFIWTKCLVFWQDCDLKFRIIIIIEEEEKIWLDQNESVKKALKRALICDLLGSIYINKCGTPW